MMYQKATVTSFDVAQMIALRERVQSGTVTLDELKEFADVISRVSEFLFKMRNVIQAHEELSACKTAEDARLDHCEIADVNWWDDEKACALNALVKIGRIVYSNAVRDCFRPLPHEDTSQSARENQEATVVAYTDRILRDKRPNGLVDPDELLNTIPIRERVEPRRFDPDPDRES